MFGSGGVPTFVGQDFLIAVPVGAETRNWGWTWHTPTTSKRFLVVYNQLGPPNSDIGARLVDSNGAVVGAPLASTFDNHWQREPSVS
jgi:hypothetical protein